MPPIRCTVCNITMDEVDGFDHLNGSTHALNIELILKRSKASSFAQPLGRVPLLRVYSYREFTNFLPLYVWKEAEVDRALHSLMEYRIGGPLGFDLEWESEGGVPRRVALVQLSVMHVVVLIQVSAMRAFPAQLKGILEDPQVPKLGVGVLDDARRLNQDFGIRTHNLIDLCDYARATDTDFRVRNGKRTVGLAEIVARYLYRALEKGPVRTSHWEGRLSFEQAEYAANDAHSALQAFHAMNARLSWAAINSLTATDYTFDWDSVPVKKAPAIRMRKPWVTDWSCLSCRVTMPASLKNEHLDGPDHFAQLVLKSMAL
ncbi:ribonuclease H-like protein [Peniophora sp. CONT]|nr:ribonuclease H-like protein [Peniophora sp. CONT]